MSVTVEADALMVYNGRPLIFGSVLPDLTLNGSVTLEKSDGSAGYDVVTVKAFRNILADGIDYDNAVVYDRITGGTPLNLREFSDDNRCFMKQNGEVRTFNDISTGNILSIYETPDNSFITIEITNKKVSGIIEEAGSDAVVIGGISYRCSGQLASEASAHLSDKCTAYPDAEGNIVWLETGTDDSVNYGYMIASKVQSGVDGGIVFKILEQGGQYGEYKAADSVKVNEKKISAANLPLQPELFADGVCIQQLVRFGVNSDGKINTLSIAGDEIRPLSGQYRDDDFYCSYPATYLKYKSGGSFHARFLIDNSTKIFIVPTAYSLDDESFAVKNRSYFVNDSFYTVAAYNTDNGGMAEAVVCYDTLSGNDSVYYSSALIMVDSVTEAMNSDGDAVYKLKGLSGGKFTEYYTDGETELSTDGRRLKRGDIIRINTNSKSEITAFSLDVNIDTQRSSPSSFSTLWSENWAISGVFYSVENGNALVCAGSAGLPDEIFAGADYDDFYALKLQGNVMIYNEELDSIYAGTAGDILTYKNSGNSASGFFMKLRYESVVNTFIFKYKN